MQSFKPPNGKQRKSKTHDHVHEIKSHKGNEELAVKEETPLPSDQCKNNICVIKHLNREREREMKEKKG
jgi:hypothetical protein